MIPFRRYIAGLVGILMLLSLPLVAVAELHVEGPTQAATSPVDDLVADDGHDDSDQCGEEHCCTDLCTAAPMPMELGHIRAVQFYREPFHSGWQMPPPHVFYRPPCHLISS